MSAAWWEHDEISLEFVSTDVNYQIVLASFSMEQANVPI